MHPSGYLTESRVVGIGRSAWTVKLLSDIHRDRLVESPRLREQLDRLRTELGIEFEIVWETPTPGIEDELGSHREEAAYAARQTFLREMPYQEYLRTDEWNAKRAHALISSGFRCQVCNASGVELNAHHRTHERRGHEKPEDLIVLCKGCHKVFHQQRRLARPS